MKTFLIPALAVVMVSLALAQGGSGSPALLSCRQKLRHIEDNASVAHPDPSPTVLTEAEVNALLASRDIELPSGVQSLQVHGDPGVILANARVDFDRLKAGRSSSNPLLSIFSGIHDVAVNADARGAAGEGLVHVNSVTLDGVEVPNFVLELLVEKYIQPKYSHLGIDSRFRLPDRIDRATVGAQKLTITQK
jgi:hypothetical protein